MEDCTGPVRVPVQIPDITHIMAAQVWHRHRTRTMPALNGQGLYRSCAGPVQFLCKTVGHIRPTRPLSVEHHETQYMDKSSYLVVNMTPIQFFGEFLVKLDPESMTL